MSKPEEKDKGTADERRLEQDRGRTKRKEAKDGYRAHSSRSIVLSFFWAMMDAGGEKSALLLL
jgi:hypothetical protein